MSKLKYPRILKARVTGECIAWYNNESKNRGMTVSEFIREIPIIIKVWEVLMDEKDSIIIKLQEQLLELRNTVRILEKRILEMEEWACQ